MTIDDGVNYDLPGIQTLFLGSGGLTAAPSPQDTPSASPIWNVPISLSTNQTWSITGGSSGQQLEIDSQVQGNASLALNFANGGILTLGSTDDPNNVSISGDGTVVLGYPGQAAGLDAVRQGTVAVSAGGGLLAAVAGDNSGPVAVSGGLLQLGYVGQAGTLQTYGFSPNGGTVSLDSASTLAISIAQPGTTAGTDYSQLNATGNVDLGGSQLALSGQDGASGQCLRLHVGDVLDLVTTTGTLTGTFTGVPDGATVPVDCAGGAGVSPTVRISYTSNSVVATVVTSGANGTSTTSLSHSPASPTTNQPVTLTATVTDQLAAPGGTVSFLNHSTAIPGCMHQPVGWTGSSYQATCQTSFAATSPFPPGPATELLTAAFTPTTSSELSSSSSADVFAVAKDPTTTVLAAPAAQDPGNGQASAYTATVTVAHAGPIAPTGYVQFLDAGMTVFSCDRVALTGGPAAFTASCPVPWTVGPAGTDLTASYVGDQNFARSTSGGTAPWSARAPMVGGWYTVGRVVGETSDSWWGSTPISVAVQWQRCRAHLCVDIAGATSQRRKLSPADIGAALRVVLTATNSLGNARVTSNEFGPVIGTRPEIKASLQAQIARAGKSARLAALRRSHSYRQRFTALSPGHATVAWYTTRGVLGGPPKPALVGIGRLNFSAPGSKTLTIQLTLTGRQLVSDARRLQLAVKVTFVPAAFLPLDAPFDIAPLGTRPMTVLKNLTLSG